MPTPHTGELQPSGTPLWTFDSAGNLFLVGNLFVNGLVPVSQGGTASPLPALSTTGQLTLSGSSPNGLLFISNSTPTVGNPGDLTMQESAATAGAFALFVTGDTNARFTIRADGRIQWGPGNAGADITLSRGSANTLSLVANLSVTTGSVDVATSGQGLKVAEGANAKQGTAVLVAGSSVVANTSVTATSRILLTSQVDGGAPGFLRVSTRSAGVSFTITSSSGTDTSTVAYQIFEVG